MKKLMKKLTLTGLCLLAGANAPAAEVLTLESYLQDVRGKNPGILGADEASQGALERSSEANLVTAPSLVGSVQYVSDAKPQLLSPVVYDKYNSWTYNLGIQEQTSFGLTGKVSYQLDSIDVVNPFLISSSGPPVAYPFPTIYEGAPKLELTQSLWGNGFGRLTRALRDAAESSAMSSRFASRFNSRSEAMQAEMTYWRLALARQTVAVDDAVVERAQKIYDWNARRARLHLADESDELQSRAALELDQVQLQAAQDEERSARLAFNAARGSTTDAVPEEIERFNGSRAEGFAPPARQGNRDDVRAAEQSERMTIANAAISTEKDLPTLEAFGSYALYGRDTSAGTTLGDPFSQHEPTYMVGLRFSMPLAAGSLSSARSGWAKESAAADKNYQQKLIDQEESWSDLNKKLNESRHRLTLYRQLQKTQEAKLSREKERLKTGRTTTYQVLLFEQDFAQSQLSTIRTEADVLNIVSQLKLFAAE